MAIQLNGQNTVVVSGLTEAIDTRVAFRYWITNSGPSGSNGDYIGIDSLSINEGDGGGGSFPDPYCEVEYGTVEPITLVEVADISNTSSEVIDGSPAHEDFTAIVGNMVEGEDYTIALEGNTNGSYTASFTVFIDWNQDGILDNDTERYEIGTIEDSSGTDGQQATATITVPTGVVEGPTRMRVMKRFGSTYSEDSCTGTSWGQAEDYTIEVGVLSVADNALVGFTYYPNPTSGNLSLKSVNNIDSVTFFNLLGQRVLEVEIDATTSEVNLSGLKTGTYVMHISVEGQIGAYKVLKN
ncbi:MAG: GEVED domain-containing protein [Aequorivita sp.]